MSVRLTALTTVAAAALALSFTAPSFAEMHGMQARAEKTVQVGGAPMYPSKNIVQNAVNSKDHTTLVAAVKAAGLVDTLQGPGPFGLVPFRCGADLENRHADFMRGH